MNISEANALNKLLDWLLQEPDHDGEPPDFEVAREAAALLADRANKALGAGWTGEHVTEAFADLMVPGWYDDGPSYEDVVSDLLVDPDGAQTPADYRRNALPDSAHGRPSWNFREDARPPDERRTS